jgi:Flp pilus assembly protein protease CpaA
MLIFHWQFIGWLLIVILCLVVCFYDLRYRLIPHWLCIAILTLSVLVSPVNFSLMWSIKAFGIGCFLLALWYYRILGGGDVKLFVAFIPAISDPYLLMSLILIGLSGGVLAVIYLIYGYCTDLQKVKAKGLPFGIPICVVGLFCVAASLSGPLLSGPLS